MAKPVAKRGRPTGALSSHTNPVNRAASFATTLMELWLAGVSSIDASDWLTPPTERVGRCGSSRYSAS